jgi:isoaspartyl peptidase/L-asparaginase-like protein (Ntn-hydrolase superfamily)
LSEAVEGLFAERLPADIGGVITLDKDGNPYVKFNTIGMFRGILDSEGMARVGIWEDEISFTL